MDTGLLASLALALTGAAAVGSILLVTTLLTTARGRANALGYVAGYLGAYTVIATLVVAADLDVGRWTSGEGGPVGPAVLVAFGLLLVALGLRTVGRPTSESSSSVDRRSVPLLDRATPLRTFGVGAAVAVVNVKNLALFLTSVAVLQASQMATAGKLAAAPLVALTFCLVVFVPVTIDLVAPSRSARLLAALRRAIERYGRPLARWLPLVVGLAFLVRGVRGLA